MLKYVRSCFRFHFDSFVSKLRGVTSGIKLGGVTDTARSSLVVSLTKTRSATFQMLFLYLKEAVS